MTQARVHIFLEFDQDDGTIDTSDIQVYWAEDDGRCIKDKRKLQELALMVSRGPVGTQNRVRIVFEDRDE